MTAEEKLDQLRALLRSYGSCLVAYSGGVDSVFLAHMAHQVLGGRALAVIADSPSLPRRELAEALALGRQFGFPVRVIRTREFDNPDYRANPLNRCYFCKHELFETLRPLARAEGFAVIAYGENASDLADFRPGAQAAREFDVRAPLKEAGLTKEDIRALSARLGLPTATKPQMACLSSRVPHGQPVTPEKLRMIEAAENVLRDLGFYEVRVRHHELPEPHQGWRAAGIPALQSVVELLPPVEAHGAPVNGGASLARIEVGTAELPRLLENGLAARVAAQLRRIGYRFVTVDLRGYRRGGADEGEGARAQT
ncbi:MAG: ATP-dependent sacrificial sulfur transferase LarE [Verrucomicrobiales bacterium]|nr:ATP-dependent sacrificial sulfur transferase LarE [Verrucomicrobiales bacterium]